MRFFAVTMATDGPIGLNLKRALLWPRVDLATKFGQDRIIRLGSGAVRNRQTDPQTDRQTEIVKLRLTSASRPSASRPAAVWPVTQQVG